MSGVRLVINSHVLPGQGQAYIDAWAPRWEEVNSEPGCFQYEVFRSTHDPDAFAMLEHWESTEAFLKHWDVEMTKTAPDHPKTLSSVYMDRNSSALNKGLEIYYEHQYYRYDRDKGAWLPTPGSPEKS